VKLSAWHGAWELELCERVLSGGWGFSLQKYGFRMKALGERGCIVTVAARAELFRLSSGAGRMLQGNRRCQAATRIGPRPALKAPGVSADII
jgi:hypothetical protein